MLHPEPDPLRGFGDTGVLRLWLRMTPVVEVEFVSCIRKPIRCAASEMRGFFAYGSE
jgi:hypothetical protein